MGLWGPLSERYEIHLSEVVSDEAQFFESGEGRKYIDLNSLVEDGRITISCASIAAVKAFRDRFDLDYFSRLDPGEAESLTILLREEARYRFCSADAIVFKVLGNLGKSELCISLEMVFSQVGLGREVDWPYTEEFRKRYLQEGALDRIQDRGLRE